MSQKVPINNFVNMVKNSTASFKAKGGRQTIWTQEEEQEMKLLAKRVIDGDFSASQVVRMFRLQKSHENQIGSFLPNKTFTAFKRKLARTIKEMKEMI